MPNGLIFYYFNDTQQFPMDSIAVANEVKPFLRARGKRAKFGRRLVLG